MSVVADPVLEEWTFAPDPTSAFGPIVSAYDVEHALAACVRYWGRDYLAELARQRGLPPETFPPYRSIVLSSEGDRFPEDQLPALVVASPGLEQGERGTRRYGDGRYDGRLVIECETHVSARGNREAQKLARLYTAAVRALCQQQALDPSGALTFRRVDWTGERFDRLPASTERTVAKGVALLAVEVVGMSSWIHGPVDPLRATPADETPEPKRWPTATRTQVTISKEG